MTMISHWSGSAILAMSFSRQIDKNLCRFHAQDKEANLWHDSTTLVSVGAVLTPVPQPWDHANRYDHGVALMARMSAVLPAYSVLSASACCAAGNR